MLGSIKKRVHKLFHKKKSHSFSSFKPLESSKFNNCNAILSFPQPNALHIITTQTKPPQKSSLNHNNNQSIKTLSSSSSSSSSTSLSIYSTSSLSTISPPPSRHNSSLQLCIPINPTNMNTTRWSDSTITTTSKQQPSVLSIQSLVNTTLEVPHSQVIVNSNNRLEKSTLPTKQAVIVNEMMKNTVEKTTSEMVSSHSLPLNGTTTPPLSPRPLSSPSSLLSSVEVITSSVELFESPPLSCSTTTPDGTLPVIVDEKPKPSINNVNINGNNYSTSSNNCNNISNNVNNNEPNPEKLDIDKNFTKYYHVKSSLMESIRKSDYDNFLKNLNILKRWYMNRFNIFPLNVPVFPLDFLPLLEYRSNNIIYIFLLEHFKNMHSNNFIDYIRDFLTCIIDYGNTNMFRNTLQFLKLHNIPAPIQVEHVQNMIEKIRKLSCCAVTEDIYFKVGESRELLDYYNIFLIYINNERSNFKLYEYPENNDEVLIHLRSIIFNENPFYCLSEFIHKRSI